MAALLSVDVDASGVLAALDALGDEVAERCREAAHETALAIQREAQARVRRRTGETAAHILVEPSYDGKGYVVWVSPEALISWHTSTRTGRGHTQKVTYNALGGWLEFGTIYMTAKPFLFVSARLEEGAHNRRIIDAINEAIRAVAA